MLAEKDVLMIHLIVTVIVIGMFIGFVSTFVAYVARKFYTPRVAMNTYTFKFYRRVRNPKHPAIVIISAFNLQMTSPDPFLTRISLAHRYPGWAIANDFASSTDEEFDQIFGEDAA